MLFYKTRVERMDSEINKDGISNLIDKEINSQDKIYKPDFSQKTGRELLAFYLQTKFKQALALDKKHDNPAIFDIKDDFIARFMKRLINTPQKRILIGITGESASGKSTICSEIADFVTNLNQPVSIVKTDNYFNDISELIKRYGSFDALRDNGYDIDSPQNFQLDKLKEDLEAISRGENISIPRYLLNGTGISVPNSLPIDSNKIIIVEGVATMYEPIKDLFDVKLYVETDINERKSRFISRAINSRNQDIENAEKHWQYILQAGEKYIIPVKDSMDIIVNGNCNPEYLKQILEYIYTITNNFEKGEEND